MIFGIHMRATASEGAPKLGGRVLCKKSDSDIEVAWQFLASMRESASV